MGNTTQQKLIEAFRKLLMHNSFGNIAVTDIVQEAGVSRATFSRKNLQYYD